jgi:hypothetical protein
VSRDGATEAIMLAHGFTVPLAGLPSAKAERVRAGSKTIAVATLRITEAGRRALARTLERRESCSIR